MSNYIEAVFGISEMDFIQTCDKFPDLKNRELILDIYNHTYNKLGLQHLYPGPNEESDHEYHQIIASN